MWTRRLTTGDAAVLHWAGLARGSKKQDGEMYHHFVLHQTVDTGPLLHHTTRYTRVYTDTLLHHTHQIHSIVYIHTGTRPGDVGTGFPGMINGQEP